MKKRRIIFLLIMLVTMRVFSQWEDEEKKKEIKFTKDPFSIGGGITFNTFIGQPGHDVRVTVPLSRFFNLVAEYYQYGAGKRDSSYGYFFKEFYFNLGFNAKVLQAKRFSLYLRGAYLFTQWTNEDDITGAGNYNGMQMGIEADYRFKYFSIYFENTTNTVWWELNSMLGIKITKFPRIFSKPKNRYTNILKEGI